MESTSWNAALYIRLSKEDGDKKVSDSVISQSEILQEFVNQRNDISVYDSYIDDGWSGTNFDRPDFTRMIEDIEDGHVNCVIVKDLSRLGRNYSATGYYIDDYFATRKVRFIAINNLIDTAADTSNPALACITIGMQNVINESVAATTSVNIRGALNIRRKQGLFVGSYAPYGYEKDPNDHHKLVIDEEAATIVRRIFDQYILGENPTIIADKLNEEGIPNPITYKQMKGYDINRKNKGIWYSTTVYRILKNEVYIGNMIQKKNSSINYKVKKQTSVPKEKQIRVDNTHEPIIDEKIFWQAQNMIVVGSFTTPKQSQAHPLSRLVYCSKCGRRMRYRVNKHSYGTYEYYRCIGERGVCKGCEGYSIRTDILMPKVGKNLLQHIKDENLTQYKHISRITRATACDLIERIDVNNDNTFTIKMRKVVKPKF